MESLTLRFDDLVDGIITDAGAYSIGVKLKDGRMVEITAVHFGPNCCFTAVIDPCSEGEFPDTMLDVMQVDGRSYGDVMKDENL